jgi:exosome complex exonuclease RRP6
MDNSEQFKALQERIQKALVATTRTVNSLANEDLSFQRTANSEVADQLEEHDARLRGLSERLLKSAAKVTGQKAPTLQEPDDVDTYYKSIVDVIDGLLERADTCLDEFTGFVKRKEASGADNVGFPSGSASTMGPVAERIPTGIDRESVVTSETRI